MYEDWEIEVKSIKLVNFVKQISRNLSVQAVVWVLLVYVSEIYAVRQDQKAHCKSFEFQKNESASKIGTSKDLAEYNSVDAKINNKV